MILAGGITTYPILWLAGCVGLTTFTNSGASSITLIKANAFKDTPLTGTLSVVAPTLELGCYKNTRISTLVLTNSVTTVGEGAFSYIPTLTSVTIGTGITKYAKDMFLDSDNITTFTNTNEAYITEVGEHALENCLGWNGNRVLTRCTIIK